MKLLYRLFVCPLVGHTESMDVLPEEAFGLYAPSWIGCRRCGHTTFERPIEDQIAVLMGYVWLWNDVRPVIEAAQWVAASTGESGPHIDALVAAVERYEHLYPEHQKRDVA